MSDIHILKYKTQSGINPRGLPRVYFCVHGSDFATYFERITDEIIAKQSCAIWYDDGEGETVDEETREIDLSQMNLFVMPITRRLLTDDNCRAMKEFRFASEHHIPVLPLMQDDGLESLFNEKCGSLQFLKRNNRDDTALSYDEKLEKFLSEILNGDELTEKIRSEFDAYIFLSYRKKDRKYAHELMRLIHKNEFCRDIAIWYDEFLTPGENFDDEIAGALEKSGIFVLTVTPNLVNEENYVMTVEYPMATKIKKPVLPVEMVRTSHFGMKMKYKGVHTPISPKRLSKELEKSIELFANRKNDNSPSHIFLVGLAYLSGVDVEVDRERAFDLIFDAADAGYPDAIKKLVSMFRSGEGVSRDYDAAIFWQRELVKAKKREYEKEPTEEAQCAYFETLIDLAKYIYEMQRYDGVGEIYKRIIDDIEAAVGTSISPEALFYYAKAYTGLGDVYNACRDYFRSEGFFRKAVEICRSIEERIEHAKIQRQLSLDYGRLGELYREQKNYTLAEEYYFKVLEIAEALEREGNTVEAQNDLCYHYLRYGEILQKMGRLDEAEEYYNKGLLIAEKNAEEIDGEIEQTRLMHAYARFADLYELRGDFSRAEAYAVGRYEISKKMVRRFGTARIHSYHLTSCVNLGHILAVEGKLFEADIYCYEALAITKALYRETGSVFSREALWTIYRTIAWIAKENGDYKSAAENYLEAASVAEELSDEIGTPKEKESLAICYRELGEAYGKGENSVLSREYYLKSLAIYEKLFEENQTDNILEMIGSNLYCIAEHSSGEERLSYLERSLSIYSALAEKNPDTTRYTQYTNHIRSLLSKEKGNQ